MGEWNVATVVAISKDNPAKPMKGQFWSGARIREIRGKYAHIRRNLQRKKRLDLVKRIGSKERRIVNLYFLYFARSLSIRSLAEASAFPALDISTRDHETLFSSSLILNVP